jgi:hypothetical protein
MAQILAPGGGISYTGDGKKLTRQVYVLTAGENTINPASVTGATITSVDFVDEAAGVKRVTVTWTEGAAGASGGGGGGKTVELIGGSREIPTEAHPVFSTGVSDDALKEIKQAIQDGREPDTTLVPTDATNKARVLYKLLLRGQDYYLAPAVSYRETTFESSIPSLREIATVNAPIAAPQVSSKQNWLLTSINARSVAQPTGGVRYEVTKEWMLSDRNGWDPEGIIYAGT